MQLWISRRVKCRFQPVSLLSRLSREFYLPSGSFLFLNHRYERSAPRELGIYVISSELLEGRRKLDIPIFKICQLRFSPSGYNFIRFLYRWGEFRGTHHPPTQCLAAVLRRGHFPPLPICFTGGCDAFYTLARISPDFDGAFSRKKIAAAVDFFSSFLATYDERRRILKRTSHAISPIEMSRGRSFSILHALPIMRDRLSPISFI